MTSWAIKWVLEDVERISRSVYCFWKNFGLAFHDFRAFNFIVRQLPQLKKKKKKLTCNKMNTIKGWEKRWIRWIWWKMMFQKRWIYIYSIMFLRWWLKGSLDLPVKCWEVLYQPPLCKKERFNNSGTVSKKINPVLRCEHFVRLSCDSSCVRMNSSSLGQNFV